MLLFLIAAAGLGLAAGRADAARVPSTRVPTELNNGARGDITVPYITNGRSTLGVYQGVAPRMYSGPALGAQNDPMMKPVYNIIYYGSKLGANDSNTGAQPREPNQLRPNR
jgi:hypothetical protein